MPVGVDCIKSCNLSCAKRPSGGFAIFYGPVNAVALGSHDDISLGEARVEGYLGRRMDPVVLIGVEYGAKATGFLGLKESPASSGAKFTAQLPPCSG